jgi:hypothetical protein
MLKTASGGLALVLALTGCGRMPSSDYVKNTVIDQLRINNAAPAVIDAAEHAEVDKLDCKKEQQVAVCNFDLAEKHYALRFVQTGSRDWSPDLPK